MKTQVYLRPLTISDAKTSYKWRNDAALWIFTKFKTEIPITFQVEKDWLQAKIKLEDEKRFAICIKKNKQYIGNIQLLKINSDSPEFHLFIGEKTFWGKGIGYTATIILLQYAYFNLNLSKIFLEVHQDNLSAYSIYKKVGFKTISNDNNFIKMKIDLKQITQSV